MNNTTRTSLLSRLASQLQKHALLVTSAAVLASPLVSHADANAAMDACVKAFVEANVPKDHPIRVRKVNAVDRSLGAPDRAYRVSLTATGATSGKRFARGTCVVDRKGAIVAMTGRSATSQLAAR